MRSSVPLAWRQLTYQKLRLVIAIAGVCFAVVLMFMQIGFRDALFVSAVRLHNSFHYDLVMVNRRTEVINWPESFSRHRLYQALSTPGVASVSPVYLGEAIWKNPVDPARSRTIFVVGADPHEPIFELPAVEAQLDLLRMPDVVLFDEDSRPEFGPVVEIFQQEGSVVTELDNRTVEVVGLFRLGTSFGVDGNLVTSDLNFLRLLPHRKQGLIDLGLIRLEPSADPEVVRDAIARRIPNDVEIATRERFLEAEIAYWDSTTPIGYFFAFGTMMGIVVGATIVYQILFADVSEHLREYATLKAIGYSDSFLSGVVLREAAMLALLGYLPGLVASVALYGVASDATKLPVEMNLARLAFVLVLTLLMCSVAAVMALAKVRTADPAEVF